MKWRTLSLKVARLQSEFCTKDFFRATNFRTKNAPKFSPKFLSLCSVGQKKSTENSLQISHKNFQISLRKIKKKSPTSFCRSAGRTFTMPYSCLSILSWCARWMTWWATPICPSWTVHVVRIWSGTRGWRYRPCKLLMLHYDMAHALRGRTFRGGVLGTFWKSRGGKPWKANREKDHQ